MTVAMLLAYRVRSSVSLDWQRLIISRLLLVILLWRGLLRGRSPRLAGLLQIQGQYDVLPPLDGWPIGMGEQAKRTGSGSANLYEARG